MKKKGRMKICVALLQILSMFVDMTVATTKIARYKIEPTSKTNFVESSSHMSYG